MRTCEEKYLGRRPEDWKETTVVFGNADRAAITHEEVVDGRSRDAYTGTMDFDFQ